MIFRPPYDLAFAHLSDPISHLSPSTPLPTNHTNPLSVPEVAQDCLHFAVFVPAVPSVYKVLKVPRVYYSFSEWLTNGKWSTNAELLNG